jgi:hypothetical protein
VDQLKLLRAAALGTLPRSIARNNTEFSFEILRELCEAGLMVARYDSAIQTAEQCFREPRITDSGRQRLAELEQLAVPNHARKPAKGPSNNEKEWFDKPLGRIAIGLVIGVLVFLTVTVITAHL